MKLQTFLTFSCCLINLSHAIQIPDDYVMIYLSSESDFQCEGTNNYCYILSSDLTFNPQKCEFWTQDTSILSKGEYIFTSYNNNGLTFENGASAVSFEANSLIFDSLSGIEFKDVSGQNPGGVINIGRNGSLIMRHINDNIDSTVDILFSNNKSRNNFSSVYGGAISAMSGNTTIDISENGSILFYNNKTAVYSVFPISGGAIASKQLILNDNNEILIQKNSTGSLTESVSHASGGFYYGSSIDISNNHGDVEVEGNYAATHKRSNYAFSYAQGGAIYSDKVKISNNEGGVKFVNNYASGESLKNDSFSDTPEASVHGGAIASSADIEIDSNVSVVFSDNYASGVAGITVAKGGAIYAVGANLSITNNEYISFSGNYVSSNNSHHNSEVYGGAIYSHNNVTISGNKSVIFEKNYENLGGTYRLRSLYLTGKNARNVTISAVDGGEVVFFDSVFMTDYTGAVVSLNADFADSDGIIQKAGGDIIFSGRYTEDHLKEIKGGTAGTASEITNSRTSELLNTVNLYGGTLRVEDKAIFKTHNINVVADGNATMKVLDATVNAGSYAVNINSTGQLTLGGTDGSAQLTAKNININQGATLSAERTEVPEVAPAITLAAEDTVSIFNEKLGGVVSGNLNLAARAAYKADGAHLSITSGTLTFNSTATDKINLILTLGAEYNEDSKVLLFTDVSTVKFVLDNITATKTGQSITLNAADYFAGEWINENTQLIYEGGNVYLTGVNRVIPEPTTATLSLFALAGLAMRRRRRK